MKNSPKGGKKMTIKLDSMQKKWLAREIQNATSIEITERETENDTLIRILDDAGTCTAWLSIENN